MAFRRKIGVDVRVVDRSGRGRFKPQSPRYNADGVVAMACWMGYGSVAVSEFLLL